MRMRSVRWDLESEDKINFIFFIFLALFSIE